MRSTRWGLFFALLLLSAAARIRPHTRKALPRSLPRNRLAPLRWTAAVPPWATKASSRPLRH